jgi:hypothetical protein
LMCRLKLRVHTDRKQQDHPRPTLHVVVELLRLWSRTDLDLAHSNCTCCTYDDENPWKFCRCSQSKSIPSRPKRNSLSSVPSPPKCNLSSTPPITHLWPGQFQIEHRSACNGRKTLQNPGSLKRWLEAVTLKSRSGRGSRWFQLFGRGIL